MSQVLWKLPFRTWPDKSAASSMAATESSGTNLMLQPSVPTLLMTPCRRVELDQGQVNDSNRAVSMSMVSE